MATAENVEAMLKLYWEADRSAIKKQYEELFGPVDTPGDTDDDSADDTTSDQEMDSDEDEPAASDEEVADEDDPGAAFQAMLDNLDPPAAVRDMLADGWQRLHSDDRPSVLFDLHRSLQDTFTRWFKLELLLSSFDAATVTHWLHWLGDFPLPLGYGVPYPALKRQLELLGISFEDDYELPPGHIGTKLMLALEEYQETHDFEPWQLWATVYDFAPRLLPARPPYPTDPAPRIWMSAAQDENADHVDGHDSTDIITWSVNHHAKRGDLVLMYLLAPRSEIAAVYRCDSDAYRDPLNRSWTGVWAEITDKIALPPLTIKEMRADPVLREWYLVKMQFTGLLKAEVTAEIWERIKQIVASKDALVGRTLEQYVTATEGIRAISTGQGLSEQEVEDRLVVPLLEQLGWRVGQTIRRQQEMRIQVGSSWPMAVRADFVGYAIAPGPDALLVIETKRCIQSQKELHAAVEQCESYAGKLRCTRFAIAAPEGIWVYQLRFPTQSKLLAKTELCNPVTPVQLQQLRELIGYPVLKKAKATAG